MVHDRMILQHFLLSLPSAVKSFVEARAPTNLASATSLADFCFEISARDMGSNHKFGVNRRANYQNKANATADTVMIDASKGDEKNWKKELICFLCKKPNHKNRPIARLRTEIKRSVTASGGRRVSYAEGDTQRIDVSRGIEKLVGLRSGASTQASGTPWRKICHSIVCEWSGVRRISGHGF